MKRYWLKHTVECFMFMKLVRVDYALFDRLINYLAVSLGAFCSAVTIRVLMSLIVQGQQSIDRECTIINAS